MKKQILFANGSVITLIDDGNEEYKGSFDFEGPSFDWPCPDCGVQLEDVPGCGVVCPNPDCGFWFCY